VEPCRKAEKGKGTDCGAVTVVNTITSLKSLVRHLEPSPVGGLDYPGALFTWR
jgi:hypothetical protein